MNGIGIQVAAPAKVNLALHVTGRRNDGYHLIETLVVFARLSDRVTVEASGRDQLTVTGPFAAATPAGPENIVMRAMALYREITNISGRFFAVTIEKNLPVAAGIGGGSSDAAAVLKAVDRLSGSAAGCDGLVKIGSVLGADLPMCLAATALIARGIGEKIEAVKRFPSLPVVLANPNLEVPTPKIFSALAAKANPALPELKPGLSPDQLIDWLGTTRNDLERPACEQFPQIGKARRALTENGAIFARMTGSGATCFGIFSDIGSAREAADRIKSEKPGWFAMATETEPSGETHGPD